MAKTKQYPDRTFEKTLREQGYQVRCFWQMRGPPDTAIAWMEFFVFTSPDGQTDTAIVETFDGGGWSLYRFDPNPLPGQTEADAAEEKALQMATEGR